MSSVTFTFSGPNGSHYANHVTLEDIQDQLQVSILSYCRLCICLS